MKRDKRRLVSYGIPALLVTALLVITGCGGGSSSSDAGATGGGDSAQGETIEIAFISPLANTFTSAIYDGAKAGAEGKNVKITHFDPGQDPQKEFNMIQDILAQGKFKSIVLLPLDAVSIAPVVEDAIAQGVEIVTVNNPLGPRQDTIDTQITDQAASVMDASQLQRGIWMGEMAVDACEGIDPCEVGYIAGFARISGEKALIDGFKQGISTAPNVKLASYQDGGEYTPEPSRKVIQNMLQANSGIDVIAGSGDQMIRGAELAVADAGLEGKVKLIGLGGSEIGVAGVLSGKWYGTVVTLPFDIGREALEIALQAIEDQTVNEVGVNVTEETGQEPKLTADNAAAFKPQWTG
ncbi:MAG: ribose transport system substrate-binding protein [Gaiellales bacterium]|jgi:ribose transport system substrate-binding protein|nr:ribose transport system substrate-binding protein [Gaiellales bacterium]